MITIFASRSSKEPILVELSVVLNNIKSPSPEFKRVIKAIRLSDDAEQIYNYKQNLPWILFAGEFRERSNAGIVEGSGIITLDADKGFDTLEDVVNYKESLKTDEFVHACFLSPSGKGLKILVKIPKIKDNDTYNSYFEALSDHFSDHFDFNNKGICRTCFASYDPDLYVNKESKVWNKLKAIEPAGIFSPPKPKPNNKHTGKINNFKEADSWDIFNHIILPWAESNTVGLGRNNVGFQLASACNDYNISKHEAINYIYNEVSSRPGNHAYKQQECVDSVESAYKKSSANKVANLSWLYAQQANSSFTQNLIQNNPQISPEAAQISTQTLEPSNNIAKPKVIEDLKPFWSYNGKKNALVPSELMRFLDETGVMAYKPSPFQHVMVKADGNIIEETYVEDIKDHIMTFMLGKDTHAYNDLFKEKSFSDMSSLYGVKKLSGKDSDFRDSRETINLPFKNGIVEIRKDSCKLLSYESVGKYIWKTDVIDHEITLESPNFDFDTFKFLQMVTSNKQKYAGLLSAIGYMMCSYKNPAVTSVVILNDEHSNGFTSEGGSGKSLISKMLGKVRSSVGIDGKKMDENDKFMWAKVDIQHKIVCIDDIRKDFDFARLFAVITDGFEVERKFKNPVTIEYEKSPKLLITTNKRLKGTDGSSLRRRFDVDINSYFSSEYTPYMEFGRLFFEDWDCKDYNQFYNMMIYCAAFYLNNGLVKQDMEEQKMQIFKESYGTVKYDALKNIVKDGAVLNLNSLIMHANIANSEEGAYRVLKVYCSVAGYDAIKTNNSIKIVANDKSNSKMSEAEIDKLWW